MSNQRLDYHVEPGGSLNGRIRIPGDKSISHRALMLGAIADGVSHVHNFLPSRDCEATLAVFSSLGVGMERPVPEELRIEGMGLHGLKSPEEALDVGNSGTSMRLLAGLLSGQAFASTLTGDASLRGRPMSRVIEPLTRMGADITSRPGGLAPLAMRPVSGLKGMQYDLPVASAQVKSCILLAGLYARGETQVREPAATRDHTERMLRAMGQEVHARDGLVRIHGGAALRGGNFVIPGDLSSAAFFLVGASMTPGCRVKLEGVGINPTRTGVIEILRRMGAEIDIVDERESAGEPMADLHVAGADLQGVTIPADLVPSAIDEFPALFVAAACARGETRLEGAHELRVKESDRIQTMADGLRHLGVEARPLEGGMIIRGGGLTGGRVNARGDHRVAMAFAMAALCATRPILIEDCANVETSFPGFADCATAAGLALTREWRKGWE